MIFAYSGFMRVIACTVLMSVLLLACGTPEVLSPRSAEVPASVDLSGRWQLRPESKRGQPGINEAIDRTDGVDNKTLMREMANAQRNSQYGGRSSGKSKAGLVGIFLETGDALKITQTSHALFISFDRAIVEEFRFGENRPINVGPANALRVSGWDGRDYVVETLGEKRMKLTDRFSVSMDGMLLTRYITLRSRDMEEVTIVQEFDRIVD